MIPEDGSNAMSADALNAIERLVQLVSESGVPISPEVKRRIGEILTAGFTLIQADEQSLTNLFDGMMTEEVASILFAATLVLRKKIGVAEPANTLMGQMAPHKTVQ